MLAGISGRKSKTLKLRIRLDGCSEFHAWKRFEEARHSHLIIETGDASRNADMAFRLARAEWSKGGSFVMCT